MSLAAVLSAREPTSNGFALVIPDTWHQGRTAYGGFSAALALQAARQVGGATLPPLRSALISFVAPLSGEVGVAARLLRTGRNAHWLSAEIGNADGIGLTASFVFVRAAQAGLVLNDCAAPTGFIPVEQALPVAIGETHPQFMRHHFEVRFAQPRRADKLPEICWWVRPRDGDGLDPITALLLSADAAPPGVIPLLGPRARVSSMTWQLNVLTPAPATRDGWWLLRSIADHAENGCSSQRMGIWNADGEAVASGMQSIALFE